MHAQDLYNALKEAYDIGLIESAPRSYSGRAMYGSHCIGIDLPDANDIFKVGFEVGQLFGDKDVSIPRCRTDAMGLGIILYWPSMEWDFESMPEVGEY